VTARFGGQLLTQDRVELHLNGQSFDQYSDGHISDVAILCSVYSKIAVLANICVSHIKKGTFAPSCWLIRQEKATNVDFRNHTLL
jgi:hypothetical protein